MKDYKRLTERITASNTGRTVLVIPTFRHEIIEQTNRLAELEDKIESGELCEREELIEHLMTAKDTSTLTDKEIEFFIKHNEEVRKETAREILKSMLNKMYKLTGCGVPYHVKKFIEEIAMEYGVSLENEE